MSSKSIVNPKSMKHSSSMYQSMDDNNSFVPPGNMETSNANESTRSSNSQDSTRSYSSSNLVDLVDDIGGGGPRHGPGYYKNSQYMSTSAFQTIVDEIEKQKQHYRRSRSASVGAEVLLPHVLHLQNTFSKQNSFSNPLASSGRRALYGTLPFVAAFGMHHRESEIRRVLSSSSLQAMLYDQPDSEGNDTEQMLADVDVDDIIVTVPLVMASFVAIIAQFLIGYNTSVMNAPEKHVFPDHTTLQWSLAVSSFAIGGPFGALLGGYLANRRGRSGAMMINTWIFLAGGLLMALAPNIYWLIPARLTVGLASGLASVVVPVYLGEIAPPTLRGTLGTLTQFSMVIGILMSDIFAFSLANPEGWRFLFAVTPVLCVLQLAISPFLLESPRWLLGRDENSPEARVIIKKMRGFRLDADVEEEVSHFLYAATKHKTSRDSAHSSGAMYDLLFRQNELRVLVVSSIVLQMGQQLGGVNAVFYYSTTFFEGIISDPLVGTTLVAFVNVVATYVALKLMDNTARRTLILWSSGGMILSTMLITFALEGSVDKGGALFGVMSFVSFFEIGLGPVPWLIVAEMFDAKYVATAMSIACVVNWACNFLVGLCFPFIHLYFGIYCFVPFGVVLAITFLFTYFYLPETHGRSVEDIHRFLTGQDKEVKQAIHIIHAVESYDLNDD